MTRATGERGGGGVVALSRAGVPRERSGGVCANKAEAVVNGGACVDFSVSLLTCSALLSPRG